MPNTRNTQPQERTPGGIPPGPRVSFFGLINAEGRLQFSLRSLMIFLAVLIVLCGGTYELFRRRTLANHFDGHLRMLTRDIYSPELPVNLYPHGNPNAFPQFTAHLNSAACLDRMREEFADFYVSQVWTQDNVEFEAFGVAHRVPCQVAVRCELPVPGYLERDLMNTNGGSGIDDELMPELEARWERFVFQELEEFCAAQATDAAPVAEEEAAAGANDVMSPAPAASGE